LFVAAAMSGPRQSIRRFCRAFFIPLWKTSRSTHQTASSEEEDDEEEEEARDKEDDTGSMF
jgi:hypothetical protein